MGEEEEEQEQDLVTSKASCRSARSLSRCVRAYMTPGQRAAQCAVRVMLSAAMPELFAAWYNLSRLQAHAGVCIRISAHVCARLSVCVCVCVCVCAHTHTRNRIPAAMGQRGKAAIAVTAKQRRSHHRHRGLGVSFDLTALKSCHVSWHTEQPVRNRSILVHVGERDSCCARARDSCSLRDPVLLLPHHHLLCLHYDVSHRVRVLPRRPRAYQRLSCELLDLCQLQRDNPLPARAHAGTRRPSPRRRHPHSRRG